MSEFLIKQLTYDPSSHAGLALVGKCLAHINLNALVDPDFSTVCRRQKTLQVQLPYRPSTTALDLPVDSAGIKFLGEGEWKRKKHGAEYRRQWRNLGIDANTLEIKAIEVTDNSAGDVPMLPELLVRIPPDEPLACVSGDGAYDTKACHAAIAQRGAQAVIPPCKNT